MKNSSIQGFSYLYVLTFIGIVAIMMSVSNQFINHIIIENGCNSQLQKAFISITSIQVEPSYQSVVLRTNKLPDQQMIYQDGVLMIIWKTKKKLWLCPIQEKKSYACITIN